MVQIISLLLVYSFSPVYRKKVDQELIDRRYTIIQVSALIRIDTKQNQITLFFKYHYLKFSFISGIESTKMHLRNHIFYYNFGEVYSFQPEFDVVVKLIMFKMCFQKQKIVTSHYIFSQL